LARGPADGKLWSDGIWGIVPVTKWVLVAAVVPSCISSFSISRVLLSRVSYMLGSWRHCQSLGKHRAKVEGDLLEFLVCPAVGKTRHHWIGVCDCIIITGVSESVSLNGSLEKLIDMVILFLCCFLFVL